MATEVSVDGGKYKITIDDLGGMEFYRHGEVWGMANEKFRHVKMIAALVYRIEELEAQVAKKD